MKGWAGQAVACLAKQEECHDRVGKQQLLSTLPNIYDADEAASFTDTGWLSLLVGERVTGLLW